jgi:hypothetical protein
VAAEEIAGTFGPDRFDLAYARNSVDHTCDPEKAVVGMIEVVKPGCYVLLEHAVDEAEKEDYEGFHQWNFSVSPTGDFVIRGRSGDGVNMTRKYADRCTIRCELVGEVLVTRIRKK